MLWQGGLGRTGLVSICHDGREVELLSGRVDAREMERVKEEDEW